MAKAAEIIEQIKDQEKKSWFLSRRKIEKEKARNKETITRAQLKELPFHIQNSLKLTGDFKVLDNIDRIIVAGTGINASAGRVFSSYMQDSGIDVMTVAEHLLPDSVNNRTLVFILSYTGEDEEAILCYRNALRKGCRIIGIVSAGRLSEAFKKNNTEHILLPDNLNENASLPYLFFPMLRIIENSKLIKSQAKNIAETISALKNPDYIELAKNIAENSQAKIPLIYTSSSLSSVATHWKHQINRIAHSPAFTGICPELCYSELDIYSETRGSGFYVIVLRDQDDDKHLRNSIAASKKIIKNTGCSISEILIKGSNRLSKLFSAINIGDWTAYHIAEQLKANTGKGNLVALYREEIKHAI
ncbi:hypothetical protein JXB31_03975 [Candidatus Woesearchaeota archaeon]|nr:hypothetical protein [Candidatus Woesearchaeota archaeon]